MTKQSKTNAVKRNINKPAYFIFLAIGIFHLITKDFSSAVIYWGIGLVFDPFDIKIPFPKRPFYQQAWLIIHLSITFALFIITFWG